MTKRFHTDDSSHMGGGLVFHDALKCISCKAWHRLNLALAMSICLLNANLASAEWRTVEPGLELGTFATEHPTKKTRQATLTILRIDATRWTLEVLTQKELGLPKGLTAKQWAENYSLVAATNAGMFATDYLTHIGYLRRGAKRHNANINKYQSVVAFGAKRKDLKAFRMFDLDAPGIDIHAINADYQQVIQNLRLIKSPGENRWSPQRKRWSEAALGEDRQGRALMIFSRAAFSMHELNERLLGLNIDLVAAQHLEGGPEAQLFVKSGDITFEGVGSFETGFRENNTNTLSWPVPNVIGVRKTTMEQK